MADRPAPMNTIDLARHLTDELTPLLGAGETRSVTRLVLEDLFGARPGHRPRVLTQEEQLLAWTTINRLKAGEPTQYVTGIADFYGLQLTVTPAVLIPRPETEELVEWILEENAPGTPLRVLDVGTGSGCIALALKHKRPEWTVEALDVSKDALRIARANATKLDVEVLFHHLNVLQPGLGLPTAGYNLIVSNPPYIPPSERQQMGASTLAHEPGLALFVPENDPLLFYGRIAEEGQELLPPTGRLYAETNEFNNDSVVTLFSRLGYKNVSVRKDLRGKPRMVSATKS